MPGLAIAVAIRCAFAITVSVKVVAAMVGSTEPSTRWMRRHSARPAEQVGPGPRSTGLPRGAGCRRSGSSSRTPKP